MAALVYTQNKNINKVIKKVSNSNKHCICKNEMAYKLLLKAQALRINNLFKESIKYYLNALIIEQNNELIYLGLANSYKALGDYEKALYTLKKAVKHSRFNPKIYYELGVCLNILREPSQAVIYLRKAIKLDNDNVNYQIQIAISHELMDEYNLAFMIYDKILTQYPQHELTYNYKATLFLTLNDFYNAAKTFFQILSLKPSYYNAYLGLALCFDNLNEHKKAMRYYKKFLHFKPNYINISHIISRLQHLKHNLQENNSSKFSSFSPLR